MDWEFGVTGSDGDFSVVESPQKVAVPAIGKAIGGVDGYMRAVDSVHISSYFHRTGNDGALPCFSRRFCLSAVVVDAEIQLDNPYAASGAGLV